MAVVAPDCPAQGRSPEKDRRSSINANADQGIRDAGCESPVNHGGESLAVNHYRKGRQSCGNMNEFPSVHLMAFLSSY